MIAVIAGATGLVGSKLLMKLLIDPEIKSVISVGRRPANIKHIKLKDIVVPNLEAIKAQVSFLKGDYYFCCLGTTIKAAGSKENFKKIDFDAIVNFAWVAQENKARSLTLISASGANSESKIFYNRIKGETENAVLCLDIRRVVILRPGLLMGDRSNFRPAEKLASVVLDSISPFLPSQWRKKAMTPVDGLVKRMLHECSVSAGGPAFIEANQI